MRKTGVELSFTPFQGKFIKTLRSHHTQEVTVDNAQETRVKLHLYPTHDFIMLLLSFGKEAQVLAPQWLAEKLKEEHLLAAARY